MIKKTLGYIIIIAILIFGVSCMFFSGYYSAKEYSQRLSKPIRTLEVWDKHEQDNRCYINVWIEVTPEEYIGLDIGDEYVGH